MNPNYKTHIANLIQPKHIVHLATCDEGQPHVRPMTLITFDGKYYFATGARDAKARQIATNPRFEICLDLNEEERNSYVRITGTMQAISDHKLQQEIFDAEDFIGDYFDSSSDPNLIIFELLLQQAEYMPAGQNKAEKFDWS